VGLEKLHAKIETIEGNPRILLLNYIYKLFHHVTSLISLMLVLILC